MKMSHKCVMAIFPLLLNQEECLSVRVCKGMTVEYWQPASVRIADEQPG